LTDEARQNIAQLTNLSFSSRFVVVGLNASKVCIGMDIMLRFGEV
jgi:hypothetical protein